MRAGTWLGSYQESNYDNRTIPSAIWRISMSGIRHEQHIQQEENRS